MTNIPLYIFLVEVSLETVEKESVCEVESVPDRIINEETPSSLSLALKVLYILFLGISGTALLWFRIAILEFRIAAPGVQISLPRLRITIYMDSKFQILRCGIYSLHPETCILWTLLLEYRFSVP